MRGRNRNEKRISGWMMAAVTALALALILTPVSMILQANDSAIANRLGAGLWKLKNPDASIVFATAPTPQWTQAQASAQLQREAIVLLKNQNNALPLQQTVDCRAADGVDGKRARKLLSALIQNGYANGSGTVVALLTQPEQAFLQELSRKKSAGQIEKIVLLWDTDKPVQPDVWKGCDADAVLWTGGVDITDIAEILTGVSPSGALPVTGAYETHPDPAGSVYTGYKYYETRYEDYVLGTENAGNFIYREQVVYPFGYGLQYTDFAYSDFQAVYDAKTDVFAVTVTVTNTGSVACREIVQIYAQSPYTQYDRENKIEKPAVKLVGFAKTDPLNAGESATLTVQVEKQELASYDSRGAGTYILDAGDYYLTVAEDSHHAVNNILAAKGFTVENTEGRMDADGDMALTCKWTQNSFDDQSYRGVAENRFFDMDAVTSRQDWMGTLQQYPAGPKGESASYTPGDHATAKMPTLGAKNGLKLYDMKGLAFDDPQWQTLLDQLTFDEMVKLIGDAYRQIAFVASVQAPGTGVGDLDLPAGEVFLSAAFDGELMYAVGYWAGADAISKGETLLRCFDGAFEDGFLAGKLRARQAEGIYAKGANILLQGNGSHWYTEQAAREQYLQAFQYTAALLPTTGSTAELVEILRQEWGGMGMTTAVDTPAADGLLAGVTAFDGQNTATKKELSAYENDPVIVSAMRQACHYNLYALVNSAAMDGIGENTQVKPAQLPLVTVCRVLAVICVLAAAAFVLRWYIGRKDRKTESQ